MTEKTEHPLELLDEYIDDSLSPDQRQAVDSHLSSCADCRNEIRFIEGLRKQVGHIDHEQADDLAYKRLLTKLDQQQGKQTESSGRRGLSPLWRSAVAASLLVIVVQAGFLVKLSREPVDPWLTRGGVKLTGAQLNVRVSPSATEHDLRLALKDAGAVIVYGPDKQNRYQLVLNVPVKNRFGVKRAIKILQSSPAVQDVREVR